MSSTRPQRKTCNEVNIRQSSLPSRPTLQARQSSTTRAASAQAGTTSVGCPDIADREASAAECHRVEQRIERAQGRADHAPFAGLKLRRHVAGQASWSTRTGTALRRVAGFEIVTCRVERAQRMVSWACAAAFDEGGLAPARTVAISPAARDGTGAWLKSAAGGVARLARGAKRQRTARALRQAASFIMSA